MKSSSSTNAALAIGAYVLAIAPAAFAQGKPPPSVILGSGGSASASATGSAAAGASSSTSASKGGAGASTSTSSSTGSVTEAGTRTASDRPTGAVSPTGELPNLPMAAESDITDTHEEPDRKYYFVGLRYRGTVIPQFLENLFVDDGATVYSNNIGIELDIRHGGSSLIPWLQYSDYNTGDILYLQKGQPDIAANRAIVNSSLKAIYLGVDEMWSMPLVPTKLDFELGFGVGIGGVFGNLNNSWVFVDPMGELPSTNGKRYSKCPPGSNVTGAPGIADHSDASDGCLPGNHQNPPAGGKVGNYVEPNWFNGGSVPVVFPHISVPQLGLRIKPIKQLVIRVETGFGLTGFWFGTSVLAGLEKSGSGSGGEPKAGWQTRSRDTLF